MPILASNANIAIIANFVNLWKTRLTTILKPSQNLLIVSHLSELSDVPAGCIGGIPKSTGTFPT